MNQKEKAVLAADTMQSFVNQFGEPDQAVTILLEILMEELFPNTKAICIAEPESPPNET